MRRIALISAAVALLIASPVAAAKPSTISVSPSSVGPYDLVTLTIEGCSILRVINPDAEVVDTVMPHPNGDTEVFFMSGQSFYSGPGSYLFECVWNNGKVLASAPLEVTS
jgi:hypothetical protein